MIVNVPASEFPTKSMNRALSGRASRREMNHRVHNQPWFSGVSSTQLPCTKCNIEHKWNEECA